MTIKLRPYSETIKENMSKEELIGWIGELEAEVRDATDLALERAAGVCDDQTSDAFDDDGYGYRKSIECAKAIRALKSKP